MQSKSHGKICFIYMFKKLECLFKKHEALRANREKVIFTETHV